MRATAVSRMLVCQFPSAGRLKASAWLWTAATSQPEKRSTCAAEYAASARVAWSPGSNSRPSSWAGWFVRSPSRRATTSVPNREGTFSPAARAPFANSFAAFERRGPARGACRVSSSRWARRAARPVSARTAAGRRRGGRRGRRHGDRRGRRRGRSRGRRCGRGRHRRAGHGRGGGSARVRHNGSGRRAAQE